MHGVVAALVATPFVVGLLVGPGDKPLEPVFSFTDPEITESSGLVVAQDGLFVTVNDSGDSARIFEVDPATGNTVAHTTWAATPLDDEALAPAAHSTDVWVGDIGDNLVDRDSVTITRVPTGRADLSGAVASYDLVYPDGPHDAETLLVDPVNGQVLVASKELVGTLYAAPRHLAPGTNELSEVGEVTGIATDGAFFPDGKHLVIRNYGTATFYTYPGLEQVGQVRLPDQQQGEGIAVAPDGEVYVCSEGAQSPVLRVALPARLRAELDGTADEGRGDGPATDPGSDVVGVPEDDRSVWPWAVGGVALVAIVLVLLRSLRPR